MNSKTYLIDVRSAKEFEAGHMEGAINHDVERIMKGELPTVEKGAEIKLYCRSGQRSEVAKQLLLQQGFINVENIGGMFV